MIGLIVEKVDPETALDWLQRTTVLNRRLTTSKIKTIAREMKSGRWRFNGEPLRFDEDGELMDGQHRCWALAESGKTYDFAIVRGLSHEAIFVTDTGQTRTLSQFLSIKGENDTSILASAIMCHHRWLSSRMYNPVNLALAPTMLDLLAIHDGWGTKLQAEIAVARRIRYKRLGSQALWCSILCTMEAISHDDKEDFVYKLVKGSDLEEGHPILALRSRIENSRTPRGGIGQYDLAPLIIKTWNAYRAGHNIQHLGYRAGGSKPEVYPILS